MTAHRVQDIWKDQGEAARGIQVQHGAPSALEYLIGEKSMTYAEMAVARPEPARELPRFVAEIRSIFRTEEIRALSPAFGADGCSGKGRRRSMPMVIQGSGSLG